MINRFKQFQRIATRYEKRELPGNVGDRSYLAIALICKHALGVYCFTKVLTGGGGQGYSPGSGVNWSPFQE